jgi:hypothetical protein
MKKLLFLFAFVFAFTACSVSNEKKAEALIKDSIQKVLIFPDSYDPIEMQLDSAFSPLHDPSFIQLCLDFNEKGVELESLQEDIAMAERDKSRYNPSLSAYFRTRYQQAIEKYDSLIQKNEQLTGQLKKLGEELSAQSTKEPEFIGYFAHQSYRAKNNAGATLIGEKYFLFDKDISTITYVWDKEELELYDAFLTQLANLDE